MPYDATNTYATVDNLKGRVTRYGYVWAGDVDDADGFVAASSPEAAYAEDALEWANLKVDEALAPHVDISPRPANGWCREKVIDLAAARYFSIGGRNVPKSFADAAAAAMEDLDAVRENVLRVPGLDYSRLSVDGRRARPVQFLNACRR